MTAEEFIAQFGRHVDARAATMLVGAGLSQPVGYPGWTALLDPLRVELGIAPIEDLPQLAQYYVDAVGRARLDQHVINVFAAVGDPDPTPAHRLLAQLPIDEFWTTNYDPLIERAVDDAQVFANDVELAGVMEPGKRRVNKMHGSIDPHGPIVLTRDDYERYPDSHPRFWQLLQAQFLTRSFLFLGFGFTDPNLELVFKLVRRLTSHIRREHFAIMKRPDDTGDVDALARDLKLFELKAGELGRVGVNVVVVDGYAEIAEILGKLVARCRPPQLMISGSSPLEAGRTAVGGAYPTGPVPDELAAMATRIGDRLAETTIAVVGAGEVGALVGYQMMRGLTSRGTDMPERFTLVRRKRDSALDAPNLRLGRVVFSGDEPTDLRSAALREVRALLVLGGAGGTMAEIDRALNVGLGIVPLACTGGTAMAYWQQMQNNLDAQLLGGRPIDRNAFDRLAGADVDQAAEAAIQLVAQALYLA